MKISYDIRVDALYIKLVPGQHMVTTKTVDGDIALDFDESNRLAGIEILGASKRLDLHDLFPVEMTNFANGHEFLSQDSSESDWGKLKNELQRRKKAGIPVKTLKRHWKNWIEEIGEDYVIVRRDKTGRTLKITRRAFEGGAWEWVITRALRKLASNL